MKKINLITILLFITTLSLSCRKYLDKKVNSSLVVPSTVKDLQALLDNFGLINAVTPCFGEASADDYFLLESRYNTYGGDKNALTYIWEKPEYIFPNDWDRASQPIYYTNLCLERIEDIPKSTMNPNEWNNVKGMSLFVRSYYFSQLAWTFAKAYDKTTAQSDLGIILRLGSDFNVPSVRSSVEETYNRIISDTKEAITYLPSTPINPGRPSKAAAYGLLSRVYMSMREYDSAYKYTDLCLSVKNELLDFNDPADVEVNAPMIPFKLFNKEVIFHSSMSTDFLTIISNSASFVDTTLYNSYKIEDLRKIAFFRPSAGYFLRKRTYTGGATIFTGIATDEIYLNKAECLVRLGKIDQGMGVLNTLLAKRYTINSFVPLEAEDIETALEIILLERRKELISRGLRWIDIKRLNKEGREIIPTRFLHGEFIKLPPNDPRYALPFPADIIALTGIPQN